MVLSPSFLNNTARLNQMKWTPDRLRQKGMKCHLLSLGSMIYGIPLCRFDLIDRHLLATTRRRARAIP